MTEEDIKRMCKFAVEYGSKPLTWEEKELLKQAIDAAQSSNKLLVVVMASLKL